MLFVSYALCVIFLASSFLILDWTELHVKSASTYIGVKAFMKSFLNVYTFFIEYTRFLHFKYPLFPENKWVKWGGRAWV